MLIFQDLLFLQLFLCLTGGLLALALGRIWSLGRKNRQLAKEQRKMEKWAAGQQTDITSIHHDASSWRAKTQRQFDALRAELSVRLEQSEQSNLHAQKQLDAAQEKEMAAAQAKIKELEAALAAKPKEAPSTANSAIPALPAMETLHMESLASELETAKAEATARLHQNAELRRSLLLARRKQPSGRRNGARVPRHG